MYLEFCSPVGSTLKARYSFSPLPLSARTILLITCYRRVRYFCYKYKASCATHKYAWRVECPMTEGFANGLGILITLLLSFLHRWNMLLSMYIRNSKDVWIRFEIRNLYTLLYYIKTKFVDFLVKTMAPKRHFEINWPLKIQEDNVAILEFISFEVLYCANNPGIQ